MRLLLVILSLALTVMACSQNTGKKEPAAKSTEQSASAITPEEASAGMKLTKPVELLPEISEKYSGIKVSVINKKDNSKFDITAPFGIPVKLGDTGLELVISSYFTSFTMVGGGVQNVSMDENNPAAKVVITDNGKQAFDGWLFQNFPDMHPFEHEVWKIQMVGAEKK